ncbi:RXLR domain-containing protein [Phytophthora infestans]|uniref:RXLR domain-containing protein n=1 Tax=Phytophthora infestans TaxID=4787 RepID=A0A833S7E8_PHYIN|nr:RXLR domain-containing protein [Phytophthora infestans]KAI9991724.1 hypothetical protein PInf_017074 [Phytophthora infestans]
MRLSLILLATASVALLVDTSARPTDTGTRKRLKQKTVSTNDDANDAESLESQAFRRVLKSVEAIEATELLTEDSKEERILNGLSGWKRLQNLRKAEGIKEIREALDIAKVEVKAVAEAAEKAAKAAQVQKIADQLDDVTVKNMLKNVDTKSAVFHAWHKENVHPQLVFSAFAQHVKFSNDKWNKIAIQYLDFVTDMAKAAAKAT